MGSQSWLLKASVLGRREKAAADELVQHAGFEGFQIERGMLDRLQSALTSAAAANSDKEQCASNPCTQLVFSEPLNPQ